MHQTALDDLEKRLGADAVLREVDGGSSYCRDWSGDFVGVPLAVLRPENTKQVSEIVQRCALAGIRMVPQGGHTGLVGGAAPSASRDEVIINLERMNKVREIDPINFSIVLEAGCPVEAAQEAAIRGDCYFPLAFGAQGSAQIGGAVATNAGGLNVLRYGMTRDLVLGLEVVLPDGRIWDGLTALRKNNTGYDLKQLFLGSEGTLGIVTAAAVRIFPRPTQCETAFLAVDSVATAMSLYALARRDLSDLLSAFELIPRLGLELARGVATNLRDPLSHVAPYYVLLEASASGSLDLRQLVERFLEQMLDRGHIVDGILSASLAQAKDLWRIREGMVEAQARRGAHLRTDVSIPISAMSDFIEEVHRAIAARVPGAIPLAYGHIGDGNVHFNVLPSSGMAASSAQECFDQCEQIILEAIDQRHGSISAEHGIGRKRRTAFLERVSPVQLDLLRRIKAALDPAGLMGPGRIF